MKLARTVKSLAVWLILGALALGCAACTRAPYGTDLMLGFTPAKRESGELDPESRKSAVGFALDLIGAAHTGNENTLVAPLSVLSALAMTANGARGNTLDEMEAVFGMSIEKLNEYFRLYPEASGQLNSANAIWFRDSGGFDVKREFLQLNADNYGAGLYKSAFDDSTCDEINRWVKDHTHGMIPEFLNAIDPDTLLFIVNAVAFDAKWEDPYIREQVREDEFTLENGVSRKVDFMYSEESVYLECGNATGFIKPYKGGRYAFAALLPDKGVSIEELLRSLDADTLISMLEDPKKGVEVNTSIPKFEIEFGCELKDALTAMGMKDAFGSSADFSGIYPGLFIGSVTHTAKILVDEHGTKASAATGIQMPTEADPIAEPYEVYLDRPFVYMLIDCETNLPFFIGTLMDVGK